MTDASTDGMAPDATTDAGIADSGTDAATNTDAGLVPPGHSTDKGSCGCSVPGAHGSSSNLLFIAGLGLVAAAARRRRRAASAAARY
jgi:MYXO-CTERM domain-containing protein